MALFLMLFHYGVYVAQIAPQLVVVEAISHDEVIRDDEGGVFNLYVLCHLAWLEE